MILTDKARADFLVWLFKDFDIVYKDVFEEVVNNRKTNHTYSDLIDFFDSVGIYIGFYYTYDRLQTYINDSNIGKYKTRQEATKQAIIKANEIYNEKHK